MTAATCVRCPATSTTRSTTSTGTDRAQAFALLEERPMVGVRSIRRNTTNTVMVVAIATLFVLQAAGVTSAAGQVSRSATGSSGASSWTATGHMLEGRVDGASATLL